MGFGLPPRYQYLTHTQVVLHLFQPHQADQMECYIAQTPGCWRSGTRGPGYLARCS